MGSAGLSGLTTTFTTEEKESQIVNPTANSPKVKPRVTINSIHKFKIHVAIDIGTNGIALAYAIPGSDKKVIAHKQWDSSKFHEKHKPEAIVLLDENHEVLAFGRDAKHMFSSYDV